MDEQTKVEPRAFNFLEVDAKRGLVTKRSTHKENLAAEILWYLKLPEQLNYLAPRIFDYSLDLDAPFVTMEFYGYRTLHEIFLSAIRKSEPQDFCDPLFRSLLFAVEEMQAQKISCDEERVRAAINSMYIDKTLRRLEKLQSSDDFKIFFTEQIVVNGKTFRPLNEIISLLPGMIERLLLDDAAENFSVIHGDLCFPNILVEEEHKFFRLIDPRGKFGDFDIFGDRRYDLAKLLHSAEGNYDLIIADEFKVSVRGAAIDYKMTLDFSPVKKKFLAVFARQLKNLPAIRLIEATLFLSMIPLHSDSLSRQRVMLARGVELFESVLEDLK